MYGYYIFLGRGDWGMAQDQSWDPTFSGNVKTAVLGDWGPHRQGASSAHAREWSTTWSEAEWKARIDFLVDELGADTLNLLMNGFELPYASEAFPEAVEGDHENVRSDFMQRVLDHARRRGLTLSATFCTTGHAKAYVRAHPDLATVDREGRRSPTNLCHNNPGGRAYAETVAREVLRRYHGFTAVSFHPPENAQPCYCGYCTRALAQATGQAIESAPEKVVADFFWHSCLEFQRGMENLAQTEVPGLNFFVITIPGLFAKRFDRLSSAIPRSTTILHWDYWSFGGQIPELLNELAIYRSQGHRVGFIPSAGWALDVAGPAYGAAVVEQMRRVRGSGITDFCYFVGAIWNEAALRATSLVNSNSILTDKNCSCLD